MRQQPGAPNGCQMIPWQGPPHSHLPWAAGQAWKMRDGPVCAAGPRGEGGAEAGASAHAQGSGASFALASQRPGEVPLPSPPPLQATEGPSCAEGVPGQSLRKEACGPARWDWPSPNPGSFPPLKHNVFIRSCRGNRTQAGRVGGVLSREEPSAETTQRAACEDPGTLHSCRLPLRVRLRVHKCA